MKPFKETLRETIGAGGLEPYLIMAEQLGDEYSPTDLAAAAFKLLLGGSAEEAVDALAAHEPPAYSGSGGDRRDRDGRGPRQGRSAQSEFDRGDRRERGAKGASFAPERGMTRLFLSVGRHDGVRPADIVGAIANEANLSGRAIGAIDLFDGFTLVDVPTSEAQNVLRALGMAKIRGKRFKVNIANE